MVRENPSAHIWALVSGLPVFERRRRLFFVLQAYIDDSGSGDPDVYVLAGYIASAESWASFSDEWKKLLDFCRLDVFKMKDMKNRPKDCELFYQLIEKYVIAGISCTVFKKDLVRVIESTDFGGNPQEHLKKPVFLAFRSIIAMVSENQRKMGILEPVDFIFDNETKAIECMEAWEVLRDSSYGDTRKFLGSPPIFRDDREFLPLQAADLNAWWIRKWEKEGNIDAIANLAFPWPIQKKFWRVHKRMDAAVISELLEETRQYVWWKYLSGKVLQYLRLY
jgi:hypothetical protein